MNASPASRTPRKLRIVINRRIPTHNRDGVRLQRRKRGDQSADSGGYANRGGQNVVGEKSGRGQQTRKGAEIGTGHGVGTTTHWVSGNGLPIGKIDDYEKSDDGRLTGTMY